jgi:two-component system sensor histidine kinase TtrS
MNADRQRLYPATAGKVRRREQVLLAMWEGKGTKEIGAELGISPKTVEYHRAELYRVFGVRDAISLCRRAMVLGFIKPPRAERKVGRKQ